MSDEKKEQLKKAKRDARKISIEKAKYKSSLNTLARQNFVLSINDPNELTSFELAGSSVFVGAKWGGDRVSEMKITLGDGGEVALAAANSTSRPQPPNVHADLPAPVRINDLSSIGLAFTQSDKDARQDITLYFRRDADPNVNLSLPADAILPKGRTSANLMTFMAPVMTDELIEHLRLNALYYSQQIWLGADPATLTMQFADLRYDGKRLIEYLDPTPVSATANYLVFRWNDELNEDWITWKKENVDMGKVDVDLVALPTGGVFAEAVLGRYNSAEKLDITRFWNWQDSPIPIQAPEIAAIQAGQQDIAAAPQIGSLEAPVVSIQNPQPLPDPQGMSAILSALATSNMFRDMSGATAGALLAQAALQNSSAGASNASSQAGANMVNAGQLQIEALKAAMPLIMAAMGIPVPPNLGNSSASSAGAFINHGRRMDSRGVTGAPESGTVGSGGGGGGSAGGSSGGPSGGGSVGGSLSGGGGSPGAATGAGGSEARAFDNATGGFPIGFGARIPADFVLGALTGQVPGPAVAKASLVGKPGFRACCALGQWEFGASGALDPAALAGHGYGKQIGSGPTGYVYTAKAGLMDIGHVRDLADMTKFVFDSLVAGSTRLELFEGNATVHAIPDGTDAILELACSIAYVESWAHELTTWDDESSFSPEDIPSNITGIEVAKRAILAGGAFDTSVDVAINAILNADYGARPKADTEAVFVKIKDDWYKTVVRPIPLQLLRRNFDGSIFTAGMGFDAPTNFPWLDPGIFEPFFTEFNYEIRKTVNGSPGVTLATMKSVTDGIRTAFVAANPGKDRP